MNNNNKAKNCNQCLLHETRTHSVWSRCNKNADTNEQCNYMIVGEAPGYSEDNYGLPFVGESGLLLELMLASINMRSHDFYITNVVKCRPSANRKPTLEEIKTCLPYLYWQIKTVNPQIILCLGSISAQVLISKDFTITKQHGIVYERVIEGKARKLIATYHPSYLLRFSNIGNGSKKEQAWKDLITFKNSLTYFN